MKIHFDSIFYFVQASYELGYQILLRREGHDERLGYKEQIKQRVIRQELF